MKINGRFLIFVLILIGLTTLMKIQFGGDLSWSGFSPVIAIALFSGMIIRQKSMSFLLPLIALLVSDGVIHLLYKAGEFDYPGLYHGQWKVYLILLSATLIGWLLKARKYGSLLAGAIAAPTVFFLVSNFAVWLGSEGNIYSRDFTGLIECYVAAIPFYRNALVGTIVFLPTILLAYNLLVHGKTALLVKYEA